MKSSLDTKRIWIYLAFAYGIAWAVSLYLYLTGGLEGEPVFLGLSRPLLLIAVAVMPAPALAHILTRLLTGEGWRDLKLRPHLRKGWPYWLVAWLITPLLVIVGGVLYYLLFPGQFDPTLAQFQAMLADLAAQTGQPLTVPVETIVLVQAVQGILIAPIINALPILGEEFGWRAYLQPKLLPLGWRRAMVLMGIIWGVWHWPIIWMGYNYGTDYPGAPWLGPLAMVWMTFVVGIWLGWLTLKGRSVWPAVIGHGSINGFAAIVGLFLAGQPNPVLGPAITGVIGSLGFTVIAIFLLLRSPAEVVVEMQTKENALSPV